MLKEQLVVHKELPQELIRILDAPFGRTQSPLASPAKDIVADVVMMAPARSADDRMVFSISSSQSGMPSVYGKGMYSPGNVLKSRHPTSGRPKICLNAKGRQSLVF